MDAPKGPFASAALELANRGLAPIPVGGDDGKKPLVRWPTRRPAADGPALSNWLQKFPNANVGVLTKLSGLTIVDVDKPEVVEDMLRRFGPTPLVTQTPSGGVHLWYRANGERCYNLRSEGLPVDIKAGGESRGGFIVVPPSIRPSGPHRGKPYQFLQGGWDDLERLSQVRTGSLPKEKVDQTKRRSSIQGPIESRLTAAAPGTRNNTLFKLLLSDAEAYGSAHELALHALELNLEFTQPLPSDEVVSTARSAWGYRERGEIWASGPARVTFTLDQIIAYDGNADAMMLFGVLRANHAARDQPFAISPRAMEKAGVIPGWGRDRYISARDALLFRGLLVRVHAGGCGLNDASLYRFRDTGRGGQSGTI